LRAIRSVLAGLLLAGLLSAYLTPSTDAERPGDGLDTCAPDVQFLGFSEALNKTAFAGFSVAELSGLAFDQHTGRFLAIADRAGPVQTHYFTLDVPIDSIGLGAPSILNVTVLRDPAGTPYNGFSFDGEGIAMTDQKQLLVASEGGSGGAAGAQQPEIRRFSPDGKEVVALEVPARFLVGTNNLSFESLALSPSGQSLFTANERPLPAVGDAPADGQTADLENRIRILRYQRHGQTYSPAEQFYYLTDPDRAAGDVGVVELIALSGTDLLVLERGFVAGEGNTVRVYRVSLAGAQDVSDEPTLANPDLIPVEKTLVFDLADCPDAGATIPPGAVQPNALLDNFEAMALGPRLPGGRRALLMVSDDNEGANQITRFVAVALPVVSLVGRE
jgi:hypothetical protein